MRADLAGGPAGDTPDKAPDHAHELKSKTAFAALWSVARVAWQTIASFIIFVVLARLLGPADFGTFALASLFVELSRILAYAGMGDAVTRQLELDESLADTAFWSTIALSVLISAVVFVAAPFYAEVVRDPAVADVLRWLAVVVPLSSLGVIHNARLARQFGHKNLAIQAFAASFLGGVAAIVGALWGLGVYALVVQAFASAVITVILAWVTFPWLPRFHFNLARLRSVLLFSISMIVTQMLWMLLARIQDIFISRWYGTEAVGRYRIAWRVIELIGQSALAPIGSVSLVTLSRLQNDPERFQAAYNRLLSVAALGSFPLLLGFGVLAEQLIALMFGPDWAGTGDIAMILVFMAVPFTMNFFASPALAAMDRAQSVLSVAGVQFVATLILTWIAVPYGVMAVAAAYVVRAYLTMPYQQWALQKHANVEAGRTLRSIWPPFAAAGIMAGVVYAAKPWLMSMLGTRWEFILAAVALGGIVYGLAMLVVGRRQVRELVNLVRTILPMRKRNA